jgi:hypothetical protein
MRIFPHISPTQTLCQGEREREREREIKARRARKKKIKGCRSFVREKP